MTDLLPPPDYVLTAKGRETRARRITERAACRGADIDTFFSPRGRNDNVQVARAICATCPVKTDCLEEEIYLTIACGMPSYGMRGGLSGKQRRRLIKEGRENGTIPPVSPMRGWGDAA